MEQALVQGEKLSAIGQLAAGVAHELRNPLFVISNVLYELRETLDSAEPETMEHLRIAEDENRRASGIIDNLLEFARPTGEGSCVMEVDEVIRQVARVFGESLVQHRIDLVTDLRSPAPCRFHPDAFKQVMVNLMTNAIDAMPRGGRLALATRDAGYGHVEVRVEDTGDGIPAEKQKDIFNPFFSTKPPGKGTGLGLWLVHSTVQRYDGRVSFQSQEGRGSTFSLALRAVESGGH
jgi:polar amino acid transport system substrate-binding protein